ncbi:MAG: hypothetical protein COY68_03090 [Candidatus Levybacteria bacterium CG_4_10_14_0_8_um_filter_35_23]|nr:MAG: hypothetical protein COY68_03090 [Candidatus Levybacteria bacterium CG_4_10_14_0_8_um_filter_35_23]
MNPALIVEKKQEYPILIVDKVGFLGEKIAEKLKNEVLIVFVSKKEIAPAENVIHIPFLNKFPTIPDNIYSHIIVIDDNDQATREALPSFIRKAQTDKALLLFAMELSIENEKIKNLLINSYPLAKIAIYGEIISREVRFNNYLNKFIYQAENEGRIEVPGDGMQTTYPVLMEDLVNGLLESIFGTNKQEKIYYILPKDSVPLLTFAHIVQKIIPGVLVDFVSVEKDVKEKIKPGAGRYVLGDSYKLEQKVRSLELKENKGINVKTEKSSFIKNKKISAFVKAWIFLSILFIFLLPIVSTLSFSLFGYEALKITKSNLEKGNSKEAVLSAISANNFFKLSSETVKPLILQANILGQNKLVNIFAAEINKGKDISFAAMSLAKAADSYKKVYYGKSIIPEFDFNDSLSNLRQAIIFVQKQEAKGEDFDEIINKSTSLISFASSTIDTWSDILGINEKKTYLVLFQNNMELRPGGGFIGSYGILTLEKGRINNFVIHDVYDADGQLKVHVEPPFAIRRFLKIPHLYLRDSNFDPDFTINAAKAAMFLNLEVNQKVNGVLAVDLNFVKNILEQIGSVYISDYNEKVDSQNLFTLTETHAEKNSFPGSTQKKDFLRSLFNAIAKELTENKNLSYLNLGKAVSTSIDQKSVLFAFDKKSVQNIFTFNGWSSSLWDSRQERPSLIKDYFGISEANIGVNKVNYFIKRSISQNINISADGQVSGVATIFYKNTSDGSWPGGDYTNYLRIILPLNSEINSIEIDGEKQLLVNAVTDPLIYELKKFNSPKGLEIEKVQTKDQILFGFLTSVQTGKLKTIKINYTLSKKISFAWPDFTYDLKIYKQPGIDSYPYAFLLTYPKEFNIVDSSEKINKRSNGVSYSGQIDADKNIILKLGKK